VGPAPFDLAAELLEQHSPLDRLEARGTLRIALKDAGLDAKSVTLAQLRVVFEKVMPTELEKRGVADAEGVCATVIDAAASSWSASEAQDSGDAEAVFRRLGGD